MNKIKIFNQTDKKIKELKEVNKLLKYASKKLELKNAVFNVIIITNEEIKIINKQYRNKDTETDVISFALEEVKDVTYKFRLLGDIYISIDKAETQAEEYEHSLLREISFLAIHGLLHLLGFDHMNEIDEKKMLEKQEEILNGYGIKRRK